MTERILVVTPTYNEAGNLEAIIDRLLAANPAVDSLVVDDGSPDGTGELADRLASRENRVRVIHRSEKTGLGAAYIAGFRWALDQGYDVIVEMDADGSHSPEQLHRLLAGLTGADMVLGSRWVTGGVVQNWPVRRRLLSRSANLYTQLALGFSLLDATGGYRAYARAVLEGIDIDTISSQGYCFQVDLAWRAARAGFHVVEVPITFVERERGKSKMSSDIVREALIKVTGWGLTYRREQFSAAAGTLRRRPAP